MIDHQPTTCQKFYRQQGARRPGDIISYRRATSSRNQRATSSESASLRLGHRLMGGASRSEAVTVLGKRRVPPLLQNLQQGLLDQSVDDARHAELSDPAVRLGDFDPLDRLRLVGSLEQLRPNAWPVLTQV